MRPRNPALALLLAALLAACSTSTPSPSPAPTAPPTTAPATTPPTPEPSARPLAEVYAEIRAQVARIRGLQPAAAVEPVVIDAAQLAQNLEAEFDATYPAASLQDTEDLLTTLGLLEAGTSLRTATLAFQSGQVAGYYSPDKDQLFVVSRTAAVGPADESTYAHEFTHQLQDQRFDLDALGIETVDQSDRALARLALVEGDATSVQTSWMSQYLSSSEIGQVLAAALDPAALAALNNAPPYLRETAFFPYQEGLAFVTRLSASGGYPAIDAAFADPPDSTEQVLHPEKYENREAPVRIEVSAALAGQLGPGWAEAGQDTLGEMLIGTWLEIGGQFIGDAATAAAGWGGDRLALYRGPGGKTVVLLATAWDTAADAAEFRDAATAAIATLGKASASRSAGQRVAFAIGDPDAVEGLQGVLNGLVLAPVGG